MKSLKLNLLCCLLVASFTKAQNVSYREIVDDPLQYKRLFVSLHLANLRLGDPNSITFGGGAEFNLNKRLTFQLVADKVLKNEFITFADEDAIKKETYCVEGGMIFNFRAKIRKGNVVYHWKEVGGEYKLKIPGKVLRTIGLRGGVFAYGAPKELKQYQAYYNTQGIYAGIVFGATRLKEISADGIKLRHTSKETKGIFYIEGMYSPVVWIKNNTDYTRRDELSPNVNFDTLTTKINVGVRLGWQKNFRYPIPLQYGFELGARPGLQNNYYALIRLAISIGFIDGKGSEE